MDQQESITGAKKYLENILSFYGVNVEVETRLNDDFLEMDIPSTEANSILIGRGAENLRSLQYMVSTMLRNNDAAITKVNIDIAGYKKQRADNLAEKVRGWIDDVRETGNSKVLHLNAADRRVVHGVVSEYQDVTSHSEGEGRERRLIVSQASS